MRPTISKIIALAAAFIICTSATVYINRPQTEASAEQQPAYYFADYGSAADILAVQIGNEFGNVTMISANGEYYAYIGENEAETSGKGIQQLFSEICVLPLESYVSGAAASDPQYGLTEPAAQVYIQNTDGDALMFVIGDPAPSQDSYYVCLYGDDRVFLMSSELAGLFLSDPEQYLR